MTRIIPFAIGFLLMAACVPSWGGMATTPRWDVYALMAVALLFAPAGRFTAAHWFGLGLIAWLAVSISWSSSPLDGADTAIKMAAIAAAFAWGATLDDIRPLVIGAAIGLAINSGIATAQWLGWHGIVTALDMPAGLFYSRDRLGESAAVVLAAVITCRMWWALPGVVPALILSQSRAAALAAGVVAVVSIWQRGRTFERYLVVIIGLFSVALVAMLSSSLDAPWKANALAERMALWSFTLAHLDWFGNGLGSFVADGPMMAWPVSPGSRLDLVTKAEHPHNEFLWLAYEGGLPALGLFGAFAGLVWRCAAGPNLLVLIAIGTIACFAMPFHDPATVGLAGVVAGFAVGAHRRHAVAADTGRDALRAWLATELGQGGEHGGAGARGEPLSVPAAVS